MTSGGSGWADGPGRADGEPDEAETGSVALSGDPAEHGRATDARLARVHLRLGAHGLGRAELEGLAGRGALDDDALLDLAEVRWRTGDLAGAGEAAQAYLATGRDDAVALVIAAEAAAALGRPGEARRLATRAIAVADRPLDAMFAGIAKSAVWPSDPTHGEQSAALFPAGPAATGALAARRDRPEQRATSGRDAQVRVTGGYPHAGDPGAAAVHTKPAGADRGAAPSSHDRPAAAPWAGGGREPEAGPAAEASSGLDDEPGFWADDAADASERLPDAAAEIEGARAALELGDHDGAALRLALALRLDPALAAAVLDVAEGHRAPALHIVRGDALRLVGRDAEARRAYATAVRAMGRPVDPPE